MAFWACCFTIIGSGSAHRSSSGDSCLSSTAFVEDRVEECRTHSREVCAEIATPGVLTLLDDLKNTLTARERELVTRLLFSVASLGFHRLASVLQDAILQLPGAVKPAREVCVALGKLVAHKGMALVWLGP